MAPKQLAYHDIAAKLRDDILVGRLRVGERLPTEGELCEQFGVGRSTVREALRALSSNRMLTTSRGVNGGSAVARLEPNDVSAMLRDSIMLLTRGDGTTVRELLEARELLEVPAARLAAQRRTDHQLALLHAAILGEPAGIEAERILAVNRSFHELLLDAAGNSMLSILTEPLFSVLQRRFLRDRAEPVFWEQVTADHKRILVAVEKGDSERAAREMTRHLKHLRKTYEHIDRTARNEA